MNNSFIKGLEVNYYDDLDFYKSEKRLDSFWFDGQVDISGIIHNSDEYHCYAIGDIRITYKDETYKDNSAYELARDNDWTDEDLASDEIDWGNNNWFEISRGDDENFHTICHSFEEIEEELKDLDEQYREYKKQMEE